MDTHASQRFTLFNSIRKPCMLFDLDLVVDAPKMVQLIIDPQSPFMPPVSYIAPLAQHQYSREQTYTVHRRAPLARTDLETFPNHGGTSYTGPSGAPFPSSSPHRRDQLELSKWRNLFALSVLRFTRIYYGDHTRGRQPWLMSTKYRPGQIPQSIRATQMV